MIEDSQFYSKLSTLESARQLGTKNLTERGVRVSKNASIPSIAQKILEIPVNVINAQPTIIENITGTVVINTAELPGVTISLYNGDELIDSRSTNTTYGGLVSFTLTDINKVTYMLKATNSSTEEEIWTNTIDIDGPGVYNCKTGKAFADYTAEEVNTAAKNHYAQYMWSVGDKRTISTLGSSKKWVILGFEHDTVADSEGTKAGMTMMLFDQSPSTYKHCASDTNKYGWEGSLIRQNGLRANDSFYTRATVTSETEGTYYSYDTDLDQFEQRELPAEYNANDVYYTQTIVETDGAFITGLPEFEPYMLRVLKETADAGSGYKKIIKSMDNVFIPSDGEVFGNNNRYSRYSRYELEGKQYDYFKDYAENKFRCNSHRWLRSPYVSYTSNFCFWNNFGYVTYYSAHTTTYVPLCFCI